MAAVVPAKRIMERHLREAHLREDTDCVAFWTDAMECWARPVPDYARSESNQFILKKRAATSTTEATPIRDTVLARKKSS
jgi:hypothetical protein